MRGECWRSDTVAMMKTKPPLCVLSFTWAVCVQEAYCSLTSLFVLGLVLVFKKVKFMPHNEEHEEQRKEGLTKTLHLKSES